MPYDRHFQRKYLILNMINHLGPISRTALIDLTDYRPATVGAIVGELLLDQLVVETGSVSTGHGRKRVLLGINKERICAIGISFSSNTATCILSQFDGVIVHQEQLDVSVSKDYMTEQVTGCVQRMMKTYSREKQIVGIGLCTPTYDPTDYENNNVLVFSPSFFENWFHNELQPMLSQQCALPVRIFNSNMLNSTAEHHFGVAKGIDNFLWVVLANGIGASVFCNGAVIGGAHGLAGELGHTVIHANEDAPICYCGKPGCVESTTAWPALRNNIREALKKGVRSVLKDWGISAEDLTPQDISRAIAAGDQMCMYYVKQIARQLGLAIANAVNLLNPETVVLHGFMLELGAYFLENLECNIRENVVYHSRNFGICISTLQDSIMPLGATAELFSAYLHKNDYKWVYELQPVEVDSQLI